MKICYICKIRKSKLEFYKNKANPDHLTYDCKKCILKRNKIYNKFKKPTEKYKEKIKSTEYKNKRNQQFIKRYWKKYRSNIPFEDWRKIVEKRKFNKNLYSNRSSKNRFLRYGLSEKQFQEILNNQKKLCKICHKPLTKYCLDHNHETNKIRGILCHNCNLGLGLFKDNINFLNNAIIYLKNYL